MLPPALIGDYHARRPTAGATALPGLQGTNAGDGAGWSWSALILREVEQKPAFDALGVGTRTAQQALQAAFSNANSPGTDLAAYQVFRTKIDVFTCPSDDLPNSCAGSNRRVSSDGTTANLRDTVPCNYLGVSRGANVGSSQVSMVQDPGWIENGAFLLSRSVKFAQITDGQSNVLFLGERVWDMPFSTGTGSRQARAGLLYMGGGSTANANTCGDLTNCGMADVTGSLGGYPIHVELDAQNRDMFSSWHPGGAQFGIGDGKVTFIGENTDLTVLRNLARIGDGNPVMVP